MRHALLVALSALALVAAAETADAGTLLTADGDDAWRTLTGPTGSKPFVKLGGVSLRGGNNAANGTWEYGVVNPVDATLDEGQVR